MTKRPYLLLQRRLHDLAPERAWPDGTRLEQFTGDLARDAHALLEIAYASGGGRVPDFERWWSALSNDPEYAPDLCFPVRDRDGFSPAATAAPPGAPPDDAAQQVYFRRYAALAFEGVTIANPLIVIRPLVTPGRAGRASGRDNRNSPDIIIGMEVLRHLHLYYAAGEQKLYITPAANPPPG